MRRYAEDTSVSVGRSRGDIDDLLRAWGCTALQWGEVALPRMRELLVSSADRLLTGDTA